MPRPRKEIEQKQFESLCGLQCTKEEICGFFEVTDKTLETWCKRTYKMGFSEVFRQKRGIGKISLRRHQWRLAGKNANMAIWLGKQYLGQKDQPDDRSSKENNLLEQMKASAKEVEDAINDLREIQPKATDLPELVEDESVTRP